jgi:hypothetical protein
MPPTAIRRTGGDAGQVTVDHRLPEVRGEDS